MELLYMDGKKEPYTTSAIIAECAEVKHDTVQSLIRNHQEDFESYGIIGFEIRKLDGRGRPMKIYRLNEQQATLLITYLKNTAPVRKFKMNLVKAFFEMRDELSKRYLQRELKKPKRKSLTEAIQTWEKAPKHAYSTLTNLLLKGATGKNKAQLMQERESENGIDGLTSVELTNYQRLEDMAIAMINLNRGYSEIKELIFKVVEIPKYFKDFKKLVETDRQLAEYLCMNYEVLDSEDLGAFLETVEQGFSWILELIESKDLLYSPQTGKKA